MAYATAADLNLFGLPAAATAGVAASTIEKHLDAASAKIDSYLRVKHALPLEENVPELIEPTCVLAAYTLLVFRGFDPDNQDETFRRRYVDLVGDPMVPNSRGWLDRLSEGKVLLSSAADATPSVSEGAAVVTSQAATRYWTAF